MKRALTALALAGIAASTIAAAPAPQQQQPAGVTHNAELQIGESTVVQGNVKAGVNPWNFQEDTYRCEDSPEGQCEVTLLRVENPYEEENARKGRERANLSMGLEFDGVDMAIAVYTTDEAGERGELIAEFDNSAEEGAGVQDSGVIPVTTTEEETVQWYRIEVVYWAHAGDYKLHLDFVQ